MKKIVFLFVVNMLVCYRLSGQLKPSAYVSPVDIPIILAGNVGEIRPNHFHSGIDIKTQGVTGKNILSVADGYVSRIFVSPSGYGKALYVNHPNGTTSVYAHLEQFNDRIAEYVRNEQYKKKSFAADLYVGASQFPVKQGELIAYSGNSGSSGGPHLHFEIRDGASQDPLNIMRLDLLGPVADKQSPRFLRLWAISVDTVRGTPVHIPSKAYDVVKTGDGYVLSGDSIVKVGRACYFAVEVTDAKDEAANTMGLYSMVQTVDGKQNFGYSIDRFSFVTTRYINTMIHYGLHKQARYDVLRTYVSPNNELPIYRNMVNRGVIKLADDTTHRVNIRIEDDNKNISDLTFDIIREENTAVLSDTVSTPVWWAKEYTHFYPGMTLHIPAKALYESILLNVEILPDSQVSAYSSVYRIHNTDTPLQKAMTLSIRPGTLPERLRSKACLASVTPKGNIIYEGGNWNNGTVTTTTRTFGNYFVTVDTIPPRVTPSFADGADLTGKKTLALTITDNLSGIKSYHVYIDGQWTLFEYDPKTRSLFHEFAYARYGKGKKHTLKAEITDAKGNKTTFNTTFTY